MKPVRSKLLLAGLFTTGLLLASGLAVSHGTDSHTPGKSGRVPLPHHPIAEGGKCVEPTEEMRRNHMEKILHQRDRTVHKGIRTTRHSLKNCVDCHADPKTNSVLGKDGFCESCHRYTSVKIDCFSCHSAEREAKAAGKATPAGLRAAATARGDKP